MFDTVEVRWPSHPFLWHRARLWDLHEVPGSGTCVACDTGDRSLTQPSFPVQARGSPHVATRWTEDVVIGWARAQHHERGGHWMGT